MESIHICQNGGELLLNVHWLKWRSTFKIYFFRYWFIRVLIGIGWQRVPVIGLAARVAWQVGTTAGVRSGGWWGAVWGVVGLPGSCDSASCPRGATPENYRNWTSAGLMLIHRLRRWPAIETALFPIPVLVGTPAGKWDQQGNRPRRVITGHSVPLSARANSSNCLIIKSAANAICFTWNKPLQPWHIFVQTMETNLKSL